MSGSPHISNLSPPVTRQQILATFQNHGFPTHSMMSKQDMYSIMESEYSKKRNAAINKDLLEQIWNESEATSKGEISVSTIADIILQAQQILGGRVEKLRGPGGMIEVLGKRIAEKELEVREFAQYHGEDRNELNEVTKELINMQIQQKQNEHDLTAFVSDYESIGGIFQAEVAREYTQYLLPAKKQAVKLEKSSRLLTLFHVTNLLLLAELLVVSTLRLSLVPLTALLHSYYLLLLGIPGSPSLMYLILHFLLSIAGDITFVVLWVMDKYEIMPLHHSTSAVYCIILLFVLLVTICVRAFVVFLWVTLRAAYSPTVVHYFSLMGHTLPPKQIMDTQPSYGYYSQYSQGPPAHNPNAHPSRVQGSLNANEGEHMKEVSHVEQYRVDKSPGHESTFMRNNSHQY